MHKITKLKTLKHIPLKELQIGNKYNLYCFKDTYLISSEVAAVKTCVECTDFYFQQVTFLRDDGLLYAFADKESVCWDLPLSDYGKGWFCTY